MSASGLVYAAIVLMWAAVLIPMWLRRHDATTENRSAERFGQAMRVLSRRESTADRRAIVVPAPPRSAPTTVPAREQRPVGSRPVTSRPSTESPAPSAVARSPRSQARASLARRRARTLAVVSALALVTGALSLLGVLPGWAPLPFVVLLVGFVVHLRLQARRSAATRRTGVAPARTRRAEPAVDGTAREERAAASRALVVETKGAPATATVATQRSAALGEAPGADVVSGTEESDPSWRPNPLPLPTYVTAPKAVRPIRVIDLTTPGAWTSGRLLEDEVPVASDALAEATADAEELDALLEHDVALDAAAADEAGREAARRRAVGD